MLQGQQFNKSKWLITNFFDMSKIEVNSERWLSLEDLPGEEWRVISGYNSLYQVSSFGRVKCIGFSLPRLIHGKTTLYSRRAFMKRQKDNGHGYYTVTIMGDKHYVHRLVGAAFIDNPMRYPEIDHINCIRNDNRASNLRWVTKKMNMANPITQKKSQVHNEEMQIPVVQLSGLGKFIREWPSATAAAKEIGISRSVIIDVLRKRTWRKAKTVSGSIFLYKKDYDPSKEYRIHFKSYAPGAWSVTSDKGIVDIINGTPIRYFPNSHIASDYYGVSKCAVTMMIRRKNEPRKFTKPKARRVPDSLLLFGSLTEQQKKYIIEHFDEIVVRSA